MKFITHLLSPIIVVVSAITLVAIFSAQPQTVGAASGKDFDPGHIIDDAVFYNEGSMSSSQIQKFLESKNPNCDYNGTQPASDWGYPNITHAQLAEYKRNGTNGFSKDTGFHAPPYKCLTKYTQTTPQMEAASGYCGAVDAGSRTAAQIINDIAKACGINPQVLIVLLEKEQSLVTDSWPLNRQLRNATGFACPDTAPCNPAYEGFFYQVYYAARQFKVYQAFPNSYNYTAGRTNRIYWHPDLSRCGSSEVYIKNQATAALYIYTPYRPNTAALNNLYGTGDSCSSYGNRNFWRIFTDWFGSTNYTTMGAIGNKYDATGGSVGPLGMPQGNEKVLSSGGVWQQFEGGRIYWKSKQGAWVVAGGIGSKYINIGGSSSGLGYPVSDEKALSTGGVYQQFENGRIYWKSQKGTWVVAGGIGNKYISLDADKSALGYPLSDETVLSSGGVYQQYENGQIYWKSGLGGAWTVSGGLLAYYLSNNGDKGTLGYPISDSKNSGSNTYQSFERAVIYQTPTQTYIVTGAIGNKYKSLDTGAGTLGAPQGNEVLLPTGGVYQQFENGRIYWKSKKGTWVVAGDVLNLYLAKDADKSTLGYPISDTEELSSGSIYQQFEGGAIYKTPTGLYSTQSAIGNKYDSISGVVPGPLGLPTSDEKALSTGGVYQQFENGRIYWKSKKGTWVVAGGIGNKYISLDADKSALGYPLSDEILISGGKTYQIYEHGRIYWTPGAGATVKYS